MPLIVLAGSDRRRPELPRSAGELHPLAGHKGLSIRLHGRKLIEVAVERLRASGRFAPVFIAGPRSRLEGVVDDVELIDTDGSFGRNIRAAVQAVHPRFPGRPVAFATCDIVADPAELDAAMQRFDRDRPCDLWFPFIRVPEDRERLGASRWKPTYRVVERLGDPATAVLPGHLILVDLEAMRLEFLYRLFQVGYRTRNKEIRVRRLTMVRQMLTELLREDLLHLLQLRVPSLTVTVLRRGLSAARGLAAGTILLEELEDAVRQIFVRRRHRRSHPERRVRFPVLDALSLALDIDTAEEAAFFEAQPDPGAQGAG